MTKAVTAFKSIDGKLYETEDQSHLADKNFLFWRKRVNVERALGVDKFSGNEVNRVVCRVLERWDELKKVMEL